MPFRDLPHFAAWQHRDARNGFEVVFLEPHGDGYLAEGNTAAVEDGEGWAVHYAIALRPDWSTRRARVWARSASGTRDLTLETDRGGWSIDGRPAGQLDGCLDVDLESSSLTNAFPVHRLGLEVGAAADAPAAYVRASDLRVERLEQRYVRLDDDGKLQRYRYTAPSFGFETRLAYDEHGLVVDYPGVAVRAG